MSCSFLVLALTSITTPPCDYLLSTPSFHKEPLFNVPNAYLLDWIVTERRFLYSNMLCNTHHQITCVVCLVTFLTFLAAEAPGCVHCRKTKQGRKTRTERKAPPVFQILVEVVGFNKLHVHL